MNEQNTKPHLKQVGFSGLDDSDKLHHQNDNFFDQDPEEPSIE